jgi:hypothetical protein
MIKIKFKVARFMNMADAEALRPWSTFQSVGLSRYRLLKVLSMLSKVN